MMRQIETILAFTSIILNIQIIIFRAVPVGSGIKLMSEDIFATNSNGTEETVDTESETALNEGRIIDHISGKWELKDTPKEQVRQFIGLCCKNMRKRN